MTSVVRVMAMGTVFMTGMLAGVMLGVALEQQTAQKLSAECWVWHQNANDQLFRLVMPPTFLLVLLSVGTTCILSRGSARGWMVASAAASIAVVLLTVVLEVPLNELIASWHPGGAPAGWWQVRDAWLRNHWWRTVCGCFAFVFALFGLADSSDPRNKTPGRI